MVPSSTIAMTTLWCPWAGPESLETVLQGVVSAVRPLVTQTPGVLHDEGDGQECFLAPPQRTCSVTGKVVLSLRDAGRWEGLGACLRWWPCPVPVSLLYSISLSPPPLPLLLFSPPS